MPDNAPPAHYDSPWKAALTHAFRAFMSIYFKHLYTQVDWSQRPRFCDKELAQIGFGESPSVVTADKLVEVCLRTARKQWLLVHVEVQAQRDSALAERVLDYNYRIFKEYGQPVASLVLLADDDPGWRPHAFHNRVLGTEMGISFATAKLLDHTGHDTELTRSRNPFALVTLAHLRTQQSCHDVDLLYGAKWQLTKLLFQHGWSKRRIIVLFKVINWMMALPAPLQLRYRNAVRRLERRNQMEWLDPIEELLVEKSREKGLREGLREGRIEGRLEGRRKGAAELLERQLAKRFGPLSPAVRKRVENASDAQISAWGTAMLDAPSLKNVFEATAR